MTREGEIVVLREHLETGAVLGRRFLRVRSRIEDLMPMTPERISALDDDQGIDVLAFLKTFEQFGDTLGRTLKTIAMLMQLGKVERLQPRDVAQRAVALGILADVREWADAVRVRNELAHEYLLHPGKQSGQINAAWEKTTILSQTATAIEDFVEREGLLRGDL
ncbi:MAG: hypothetical protein ACRYFW_04315 [Janthinobacterium lividum]